MTPSILFSTSYNPTFPNQETEYQHVPLHHYVRPTDFKVTRLAKLRLTISSVVKAHHVATQLACSHLVLCSPGYEVPLTGLITRLVRPSYKVVALDYLMPTSTKFDRYIAKLMTCFSAVIVIRSGDMLPLTNRFGIPKTKLAFLKFPIAYQLPSVKSTVEPYIFSGGAAHRDWITFCNALDGLPMNAKVSTNTSFTTLGCKVPHNIEQLGLLSPAQSRKIMETSELVCLSFQDTLLPSGPLVLLDAMAAGKPIVATECNGTRDYLTHRHNGILFPPRDYASLRSSILELHADLDFRRQLGLKARQTILDEHMPQQYYKNLFNILNLG
jgi:hypothetical protein